jgi:carbon-monoxide dehydrogenase small subunit
MIMTAKALLDQNSHPTEMQIKEAIGGNLCRCTGYAKIVDAIDAAASTMSDSTIETGGRDV